MKKLSSKQKTEAAKNEFKKYMVEGVAALKIKISPQDNARKRTQEFLNKRITNLVRGVDIVKDIPMGMMLYLKASHRYQPLEMDMVVTPLTFNNDSVRCILWTQQYLSFETTRMLEGKEESKQPLRFVDIISWKLWSANDAALTINHQYQSPAYKKFAYNL